MLDIEIETDFEYFENLLSLFRKSTVYTAHPKLPPHGHPVIDKRPSLKLLPFIYYPVDKLYSAWRNLVQLSFEMEISGTELPPSFTEDLVDVGRQCLEVQIDLWYSGLVEAYKNGDLNQTLLVVDVSKPKFLIILARPRPDRGH